MRVNIWILGMISLPWAKVEEVFYFLIVCGAKRKGRRAKGGRFSCWSRILLDFLIEWLLTRHLIAMN